jgi:CBS domain containing-hemolysin-like protein
VLTTDSARTIAQFLPQIFEDAQRLELSSLTRPLALSSLTRPLAHISDRRVLRGMREGPVHLALVHDELRTVIGLLTMEDILQELVGEI